MNKIKGHKDINHIFVKNDGIFNKSWGCNIGAKTAKGDYLIFNDSDLFLKLNTYHLALKLLNKYDIINPYKTIYYLDEKNSNSFASNNYNFNLNNLISRSYESTVISGGIFLIKKEKYLQLKGFDEDCYGWGIEDGVFDIKIKKSKLSINMINDIVVHTHHIGETKGDNYYSYKNMNENIYRKYESMSEEQFNEKIKSVKSFGEIPNLIINKVDLISENELNKNEIIDVIILHGNADDSRTRNLFFVVKYYKEYLPNSNIIIVEQNTETDINEIKDLVGTHLKIKMPKSLFCRSYLFNEGYNIRKGKYLIFSDNDCVINKDILININNLLTTLDKHIVLPYNKPVFNLNEIQTKSLITDYKNFNYGGFGLTRRNCYSNGGVVMISSENYYKIGGHDPRFIGWGGEDDAFFIKSNNILGVVRLNYDLFHLNHPKNLHNAENNPNYKNNYAYYMEYLNGNSNDIINKIGWNHLKK